MKYLIAIPLVLLALICAFLYGKVASSKTSLNWLQCEGMHFTSKSEYYSCVQARELIHIREMMEKYD